MSEERREAQGEAEDGERDVESAAPENEEKVVGDDADVPAGEGEEADEAGVEGGEDAEASGGSGGRSAEEASDADEGESREDDEDDRDPLAREIESDPASNPEDPELRDIKGG